MKYLVNKLDFITRTDVVIFFLSALFFTVSIFSSRETDTFNHAAGFVQAMGKGVLPPPNFLYYLTVYTFALFNTNLDFLLVVSAVTLALSVTAKLIVTRSFFVGVYQDIFKDSSNTSAKIASCFSVLLLIVFSLPTDTPFIGQLPPNVWHNSTTIFLMPFAVATFWLSYKQLVEPKSSRILPLTILCILSIFAKPSFFIVFALAYPLMLVKCFGLKKRLWQNLIPIFIGTLALVAMYYLLYGSPGGEKTIFSPFTVWSVLSSNIPRSLVASLVFPIAYLALYPKDLIKHLLLQYAVVSYLIALLIYALLSETGARQFHGNLGWQAIVFNYILFLCLSICYAEKIRILNWKNIVIAIAFLSHFIAGIFYIKHMLGASL